MRSLIKILGAVLTLVGLLGVIVGAINTLAPSALSSIPVVSDIAISLNQTTDVAGFALPVMLIGTVVLTLLGLGLLYYIKRTTTLAAPNTEANAKEKKVKVVKPRYKRGNSKSKKDASESDVKPLVLDTAPPELNVVEEQEEERLVVLEATPEPRVATPKTLPQMPLPVSVPRAEEPAGYTEPVEEVWTAEEPVEEVAFVEDVALESEPTELDDPTPVVQEPAEVSKTDPLQGIVLPPIPPRPSASPVISPPPILKPPSL